MYREAKHRQVALRLFVLIILICLGDASGVAAPGPASPFTLQVEVFNRQNSGLPGTLVDVILPDKEGGLWVGTWMGLARFHQGQWRIFTRLNSGLPNDGIKALALNQDGSLWVTTGDPVKENGTEFTNYTISQFHNGEWKVFHPHKDLGFYYNETTTLYPTPDGTVWGKGEFSGSLSRYQNGRWENLLSFAGPHQGRRALASASGGLCPGYQTA